MKKMLSITLVAIIAAGFTADTEELLVPGVGIENYVIINATTGNEIKVKYGSVYKEIKHTQEWTTQPFVYSIERRYEKSGLSFFFKPTSDTVFSIHAFAPFKGKTGKGIVLGKSTLLDAENAYGKADVYEAGNLMFTEYPGIRFYVNKGTNLTQDQIMKQTIVKIAITEIK